MNILDSALVILVIILPSNKIFLLSFLIPCMMVLKMILVIVVITMEMLIYIYRAFERIMS